MKKCWYCQTENEQIAGDFVGDFNCISCGVENDCLNGSMPDYQSEPKTTEEEWLNNQEKEGEREMSPFDKPEKNYLSLPKVGEEYDFSQHGAITEIKKVEGQKGFNFTKKESLVLPDGTTATVDKDLGYHYVITFEDNKMLSVSSWKPYYAMEKAGLIEGVKFSLSHPVKGEWVCLIV